MSRAIGSGILLNIFLMWCRGTFLWDTTKNRFSRIRIIVLSGSLSVLLAAFSRGAKQFGLTGLAYTDITQYTSATPVLTLIGGILLLALLARGIITTLPRSTSRRTIAVFITMLALILLGVWGGFITGILTRALIARLEEWTKLHASTAFFDRFGIVASDILFTGMISALGFAFIENIVYLLNNADLTLIGSIGLVIKRMCTSRAMHLVYTGLITYGIMTRKNQPTRRLAPISIITSGVLLHTLFNTLLQTPHTFIVLLILMGGYFFLSRLLYKTDRVYV